jgi:hypothetical protein
MPCPRCIERGKTWSGSDPKCAFESGVFSGDNWQCATMNDLREAAAERGTTMRDDLECGSFGYLPFSGEDGAGYIAMSWYKDRGATGMAVVLEDDQPVHLLTLREAELALQKERE